MPRFAASRTLAAPVEDVWALLAEPANWPEWWPGLEAAEPTVRRAFAPGALWQIAGTDVPSFRRRPQLTGTLLLVEVVPPRQVVFQLSGARIDVELDLEPTGDDETVARLVVEAPRFSGVRRPFPSQVLARLHALVGQSA